MSKARHITVFQKSITVQKLHEEDYICLTDIARHRDAERGDYIIQNWMRNRNTIEFLGIWERLNNPDFNSIEFDGIKNQSGLNSFSLTPKRWTTQTGAVGIVAKTAKQWRDANPGEKGNVRDFANGAQLVCLANLECLNAHFINEGVVQSERLIKLNQVAIRQMGILMDDGGIRHLEEK